MSYTALIQKEGRHWIGWIAEIPGVNGMGETKPELMASLRSALQESLRFNRRKAVRSAGKNCVQESVEV